MYSQITFRPHSVLLRETLLGVFESALLNGVSPGMALLSEPDRTIHPGAFDQLVLGQAFIDINLINS
jgi:hypothetical protein